ncbi:hypothetical protein Pmar_PMAR022895 [Perkinsus marinus ATCC 50983]|uniref:Uncharacterized protein n=1 Tax=Perkinsus marinus (strain ATCC 50983 / TXsc) TaxID=423536 RepID=C5LX55_PERM5|nr:hypothetical protein Pmar_PMAR022895 [Perkinsus marinus ATCC 50983]EEQ98687.1 hypothetical protein Pmar_PMAR022895 [Perkinsus marinus ATCC 50983]|eukprot:XP_002765970.1 hypothetical protein Pmar_PMAR022895 [Perkinsus marinus ATCC 50983]
MTHVIAVGEEDLNEELTRMIASNRDDCAGVDRHRDPFLTERYITVEEADRLMECPTRGEAVEVGSSETV